VQKLSFYSAIALLTSGLAWAQATVNENLETSIVYVDAKRGSDGNPGTQSSPLKTIGAAAQRAQTNNTANIGTRVIINPGTYREVLSILAGWKETSKPVTFQAARNGTVFISGAVQHTGWAPYSGNSQIYTASWPNRWGFCAKDSGGEPPLEQQIVMRREMIFVNGTHMTQVLSLAEMIFPGTFFVDESRALVYVWPPSGTDMATADVEVATNPMLLDLESHSGKPIDGIVFRGLTFEHANSCHSDFAFYTGGAVQNLIFDGVTFRWNNGGGVFLDTGVSNITVLNSMANHNGGAGFTAHWAKKVLWQGTTAAYNNWRGAQGAYYTWNTGGYHLFSDHDDTFTSVTSKNNQTFGIHWDTDNLNISATNLINSGNVFGMSIEKDGGPIKISNGKFCNNGYGARMGIAIRDSENVSITNSTFYNNALGHIVLMGQLGGFTITNWETGQLYNVINKNLTFTGNTVVGSGTRQQMVNDGTLGGTDWTEFSSTLHSDHNTWWNPTNTSAFIVPSPRLGTKESFEGWRSATSQDGNSTFSAPAKDPGSACATTGDPSDYWLLADDGVVTTDLAGNAVFNLTAPGFGGFSGKVTLAAARLSRIPGATATFSANPIAPGGTSVLRVNAARTTPAGTYNFTLLANSGNVTRTAVLSITVPVQTVRLSATSLTFPSQKVKTTSAAHTITLTNLGKVPLVISSIHLNRPFAETNTCGASVAAGASCHISVTFAPHTTGEFRGRLTITDSAGRSSPQKITLTGTGI
jgi:hypothetical protein